ncbi:hypothetical protein AOLI_G00306870 [Acnodon oligacanthus]
MEGTKEYLECPPSDLSVFGRVDGSEIDAGDLLSSLRSPRRKTVGQQRQSTKTPCWERRILAFPAGLAGPQAAHHHCGILSVGTNTEINWHRNKDIVGKRCECAVDGPLQGTVRLQMFPLSRALALHFKISF